MKLYIANQIFQSKTLDRPVFNTNQKPIGFLVYISYYMEKKLTIIIKNEDKSYTYIDGTPCTIINPKSLDLSHETVTQLPDIEDALIGIANLRPIRKVTKKKELEVITSLINEYNEAIGNHQIYITRKNYKTTTEYISDNTKKTKKKIKVKRRKNNRRTKHNILIDTINQIEIKTSI